MMSSTAWSCLVLSPATLHSVSGTAGMAWCRCVTRPVVVHDRWPTTLTSDCSCTIAACLTVLPAQSC
jgi:hypothetical protein